MEKLNSVLFYSIEKAIKTYRQFAQKELKKAGLTITVDQWLTLKCLFDNPDISQKELAEMVFKDTASITRIIDLLVNARYLKKTAHKEDKRKSNLTITEHGLETIEFAEKVVENYRKVALKGIGIAKEDHVNAVMKTIINNCQ
ncbi:MAG: MarR family transcriptional regulator [Bacteroidetes bacterium]|jgi:DNA-binding MarR family transcriptional regulator|nr:MarR family transcriptional regulator [Bacteroidota bacterium]MDF2453349.1 MarR family transcriptional regulator [Bacteroidota bacterium]